MCTKMKMHIKLNSVLENTIAWNHEACDHVQTKLSRGKALIQ